MRIRLKELMEATGTTPDEVAKVVWPESNQHTRYVSMKKWLDGKNVTINLSSLWELSKFFGTTNIEKLIEP
jgi:hypothetical protein